MIQKSKPPNLLNYQTLIYFQNFSLVH